VHGQNGVSQVSFECRTGVACPIDLASADSLFDNDYVKARRSEAWLVLLAAAYLFFLLFSYYLLRPLREAMGIARGAEKLPWLMTATMATMFVANPLHAWLVSRMNRRRFIPWICHFFAVNLAGFYAAFRFLPGHGGVTLGYVFYVWLSVFNLFVISVFWGLMTDVFAADRAKRSFGIISVGGTLGAIAGAKTTSYLMQDAQLSSANLMVLALLALELGVVCMLLLAHRAGLRSHGADPHEPGPALHEGMRLIAQSRYLQLISGYIFLFTIASTLLYVAQGHIVEATFANHAAQTAAFADIDMWVNIVTLATQLLLTAPLLRWLGVHGVVLVLPLATLVGFGALWLAPVFATLAIVQVVRRGLHYAVDRPARELMYVPLGPEAKYKSKPFIDTFVYRAGDFAGVWLPTALAALAVPVAAAALAVSTAWIGVALGLRAAIKRA